MSVVNRPDLFRQGSRLALSFAHFARGTFPCSGLESSAFHVNRLFFVLENPKGEQNYLADAERRHPFRPGEVYLAPAFHPVCFRLDDELQFLSIHFNLELFSGVDLFSGVKRILTGGPRPETIRRLKELHDLPAAFPAVLEFKALIYSEILPFADRMLPEELETATRFAPYRELLDHLRDHISGATRVEDLARFLHLSRETFSRRFTADTGIQPKKFLDRQLLTRATELLLRPHAAIREVADELGFSSEFVFSRFFKKQIGITPRAYRSANQI